MKLVPLLFENISKSQAKSLNSGDIVWVRYSTKREAVKCEFVEFIPGDGFWKDRIKIKGTEPGLNLRKDGTAEWPLSSVYLVDPEFANTSSKKGFLYKGVHGPKKWK